MPPVSLLSLSSFSFWKNLFDGGSVRGIYLGTPPSPNESQVGDVRQGVTVNFLVAPAAANVLSKVTVNELEQSVPKRHHRLRKENSYEICISFCSSYITFPKPLWWLRGSCRFRSAVLALAEIWVLFFCLIVVFLQLQ